MLWLWVLCITALVVSGERTTLNILSGGESSTLPQDTLSESSTTFSILSEENGSTFFPQDTLSEGESTTFSIFSGGESTILAQTGLLQDIRGEDSTLPDTTEAPSRVTEPSVGTVSLFNFNTENIKNEQCRNDTELFLRELSKLTLWAVQMFDASAKLPSGILYGATHALGGYDECLAVGDAEPPQESGPLRAKYCLARVTLRPAAGSSWLREGTTSAQLAHQHVRAHLGMPVGREPRVPAHQHDMHNLPAWLKIQRSVLDPSMRRRDELHLGVCVPASCGAEEVGARLAETLRPLEALPLGVETAVTMEGCETRESSPLPASAILMASVIVFFLGLVILGTAYDIIYYVKSSKHLVWQARTWERVLLCFSLYRNLKRLLKNDADEHHLKCMHGIKLYSMACVILGHRIMYSVGSPILNPPFVESFYQRLDTMILLNGFIIVDTFFTISGFLVCYLLISTLEQGVRVPLPALYVHRYLRLTPVYMVVVGFYATLLPHTGDGPLWLSRAGLEARRCAKSWWANLLYVNNYVQAQDMCVFQSWYLACDMQLFVVAVPIAWLLWRRPRAGRMLLAAALLLSAVVPFVVTWLGRLDPLLYLYMNTLVDPVMNDTFRLMYAPTHTRGSPYFIGMAFGYLTFLNRTGRLKITRRVRRVGWLVLPLLPVASMLSAWIFYLPGRQYEALEAALYGSLHRVGWSLGISWVVFAVCTGGKGLVQLLLSMKPVIPLGRLTYCAFLSHAGLQLYSVSSMRAPAYISFFSMTWMTFGDVMLAFALGGALSLMFESPILGIEKMLFGQRMKEANKAAIGTDKTRRSSNGSAGESSPSSSEMEFSSSSVPHTSPRGSVSSGLHGPPVREHVGPPLAKSISTASSAGLEEPWSRRHASDVV